MDPNTEKAKMEIPPAYSGNPPPYTSQPMPGVLPPQQYSTTVVHAAVVPTVIPMVVGQQMSPQPARLTCKSCNVEIVTRVEMRSTMKTHLFAALLCLLGCWPCVCIPYCMESCNNADHYCPNCSSYLGSYIN